MILRTLQQVIACNVQHYLRELMNDGFIEWKKVRKKEAACVREF
jgi:hypothetical protein